MNLNTLPHRWQAILSIEEQRYIKETLYSTDVDWIIANATVTADFVPEYNYDERIKDTFNCVHKIYYHDYDSAPRIETPHYMLVELSKKIGNKIAKDLNITPMEFVRIKANTIFNEIEFNANNFNIPHKDYPDDNILSVIYYVDTVDGDTVVFEEYNKDEGTLGEPTRYKPIQGSAIALKSNVYHSSSNPVKHRRRTIINIAFRYEENDVALA